MDLLQSTEQDDYESRLQKVRPWIDRAALALLSFYAQGEEGASPGLWRDSLMEEGTPSSDFDQDFRRGTGATSTNRGFYALAQYAYFCLEDSQDSRHPGHPAYVGVRKVLRELAEGYYGNAIESVRQHSSNAQNMFGDSHILMALNTIGSDFFQDHILDGPLGASKEDRMRNGRAVLFQALLDDYRKNAGGRVHDVLENHSFVTLHATRALDVAAAVDIESSDAVAAAYRRLLADGREHPDSLWLLDLPAVDTDWSNTGTDEESVRWLVKVQRSVATTARTEVLQQLGLAVAKNPRLDPASLVFNSLLLQRFQAPDSGSLIKEAMRVLVDHQHINGTWQGGVLTFGRMKVLFISSVELALSLTHLANADLWYGDGEAATIIRPALDRCFRFVTSSYMEVSGRTESTSDRLWLGWANDRSRSNDVVESWSTALALQFLVRYEENLRGQRQRAILERYSENCQVFRMPGTPPWPDAAKLVRAKGAEVGRARRMVAWLSDPTTDGALRTGVLDDVIRPILEDDFVRPAGDRTLLLYGPPGSRKTSLLSRVAEALGWPLLVLSPPDFMLDGIEKFESRAQEVFADLRNLRRVVVLFDECEEFFRRRVESSSLGSRTAGAFITTGMLPRLQSLRNLRWTVVAIVTNVELDELDPAVTRPGRLDVSQRVGLPGLPAQKTYLQEWQGGSLVEHVRAIGSEWSLVEEALDRYDRLVEGERKALAEARVNAKRERRQTGDWRVYQTEMAKLRVRETEAAFVSFAKLDELADAIASSGTGSKLLANAAGLVDHLDELTKERSARSWSEIE